MPIWPVTLKFSHPSFVFAGSSPRVTARQDDKRRKKKWKNLLPKESSRGKFENSPYKPKPKKKKGFQDHSFLPPPFLCRQAVTTEAQETTPTFPSHRNFCLYDRERLVTLSSRNERQALLFLVVGTELRRKRSQLFQNLGVQSSKAPKLSKTKLDANENGGERERERERERKEKERKRRSSFSFAHDVTAPLVLRCSLDDERPEKLLCLSVCLLLQRIFYSLPRGDTTVLPRKNKGGFPVVVF